MSSKKKKNQPNCVQCDKCEAIFAEKDSTQHATDCPPTGTKVHISYVFRKTLNCLVNGFTAEDEALKYISKEDHNDFVLLSQPALQLCNIPIGDYVLVTVNGIRHVKRAWKGNSQHLLTASFSENGNIFKLTASTQVKVENFLEPILTSVAIHIQGEDDCLNHKVLTRIQQLNSHKIFSVMDTFEVIEYGKTLKFRIVEIVADGNQHCTPSSYYKVFPETTWRFYAKKEEKIELCLLDMIGGLQDVIDDIEESIKAVLGSQSFSSGFLTTRGIILFGPNGTGKSLLMEGLARKWMKQFRHFHLSSTTGQIEKDIAQCFKHAEAGAPSLITLDDLDVICSNASSRYGEHQPSSLLASLFDRMRILRDKPILILAACNDVNKVEKSLRRPGRFDKEIEICVPNPQQRLSILQVLLQNVRHHLNPGELKTIADGAHGFVGADLAALLSKAVSLSLQNNESVLQHSHLLRGLSLVRPSALREIMIQVPNVKWEDIGGQSELKHSLRQIVEWPLKYADSFTRLGISPPRGVLMYGPPGCSKTMIAKALATESGLNFISVKGPELFSKWVGESEKAVREVFRKARQSAPCIVFFDELDALAGERLASGAAQVQERVLAQLLTELDGVEALGHVIVVGATNRPDRIDPALLRPGRLDRVVHVPLPDYQTRCDIFSVQIRKTPVSDNVKIDQLSTLTEGYSGAEVVAVCHEAALNALEGNINAEKVTADNFMHALKVVTPRTPQSALDICRTYSRAHQK